MKQRMLSRITLKSTLHRAAIRERLKAGYRVDSRQAYQIVGFDAAADESDPATLAKEVDIPFVVDIGSGSLIDIC